MSVENSTGFHFENPPRGARFCFLRWNETRAAKRSPAVPVTDDWQMTALMRDFESMKNSGKTH